MVRPRLGRRFLILVLALLVVFTGRGRGQQPGSWTRVLLDAFAPPAIDRGLLAGETRAPDSIETVRRAAIRDAVLADRVGVARARYVPGRVIVKFREGTSAEVRATALSSARSVARTAWLTERPSFANFDIVSIDPGDDPEAVAGLMAQRSDVEYAQASYRVHTMMVPNDSLYKRQWNMPFIDMERAWDIQPQAGSSITVAVLDTGIAYTAATVRFHASAWRDDQNNRYPDLGDLTLSFVPATELVSTGRFVAPHDFIWNDELPLDLDGHGTHVSGTIGQLTNNSAGAAGVAFNVKLMPVKVIDTDWDDIFGSPNFGTDDTVARGMRYAADNGAKVINMSIGRTGPPAPVIEDAMKYAVGKGVFLSISAGNDFESGNATEVLAEIASRVQGAVSVAAVDQSKSHAYYSSSGGYIELAAPGGSFRGSQASACPTTTAPIGAPCGVLQQTLDLDLVETFLQPPARYSAPRFDSLAYFYFIGTSQAAPHVSGLAAMLMQQGITDPVAVELALEHFATDLGAAGRDDLFGYGLVEARNTLRGLGLAK